MFNILIGKTNVDCINAVIEKLKQNYNSDSKSTHIVLVPDRVSVLTEIKIFESLKIESTCNIRVLTLSRLASLIASNVRVIPKVSSCMLFQKFIKQFRSELKCFNKKIDADLSSSIYKTISQFKSCKVLPQDVKVTTENKILEDKLSDLSILYSAYQKHLKDNNLLDSMDRLDFVIDSIANNDLVKNSYFYVGFFDSFTLQGYQVLSGILKNCKGFNIGLTGTDNSVNEHIYDKSLQENILKIFEFNKITPNIVFCREGTTGQFKFLQNNLYAFNYYPLKINKSDIELFEGKSFEEELLFCCSNIKQLLQTGKYSFNDIVVAVPNLKENYKKLEHIFEDYNFNFYVDVSQNFNNNILVRLLDDLVNVVLENFSRVSVLSLLKNALIEINLSELEDFEDYLIKYNLNNLYDIKNSKIENSKFYSNFARNREKLFFITDEFLFDIENSKTYTDFISAFEKVLLKLNVPEKLVNFTIIYTNQNNIKQAKLFEQYYNSLTNIFDLLKEVLGSEECDLKLFYSTLLSGINETKISTPPISTNAIFVGDASSSFFDSAKIYFILNANEKDFPFFMNDCGIISDKEIDELSETYKLEPSIESINAKERFKSFELVLKPSQKLFISYNYSTSLKSKILEDISKMFVIEEKNGKFYNLQIKTYNDLDFFVINNNLLTAKENLITKLREVYDGKNKIDNNTKLLFSAVNKNKKRVDLKTFNFKNNIKLKNNIFFTKNTVSVSQVEQFMTCPFLHFAKYGLNLKEKDFGALDSLNIGNILHNIAKVFIDNNTLPLLDKEVEKKAELAFNEVIKKDVYESVKNNPFNKVLIKNLLNEAKRFCFVINYQAKYSKFKPFKTEVRFDNKNIIKSLKFNVSGFNLELVGQVDRIDKFENYFRIIDYKTGKCDTSLKELFFGKKVQLEAYLKVIENSLKLKPAGAYYMPVKSSIADENCSMQQKYQLKGRTILNNNVIIASDHRLEEENLTSDIIEVKYNKVSDGQEKKVYQNNKAITEEDLEKLSNYAIDLIYKSCSDILKLNITPSPLVLGSDNPCNNCNFSCLCKFDENLKNIARNPSFKISLDSFENNK